MRKLLTENGSKIFVEERAYGVGPELLRDAAELFDLYAPKVIADGAVVRMFYTSREHYATARNDMKAATGIDIVDVFPEDMRSPTSTAIGGESFIVMPVEPGTSYEELGGALLHELCHCELTPPYMSTDTVVAAVEIAWAEYTADGRSLEVDSFAVAAANWCLHTNLYPGMKRMAIKHRERGQFDAINLAKNVGIFSAWLTREYPYKETLLPVFRRIVDDYAAFHKAILRPREHEKHQNAVEAALSLPFTRETFARIIEPVTERGDIRKRVWVK